MNKKGLLCFATCMALLCTNSTNTEAMQGYSGDIPVDAYVYNGHSYYVYSDVVDTWEEAKQFCEVRGGYLAIIDNRQEDIALYKYLLSTGRRSAYFGLTDAGHEGLWRWVNGKRAVYTNWNPGEPSNGYSGENYAGYYWQFNNTWNDGDFGEYTDRDGKAFICEWDYVSDHTPTPPPLTGYDVPPPPPQPTWYSNPPPPPHHPGSAHLPPHKNRYDNPPPPLQGNNRPPRHANVPSNAFKFAGHSYHIFSGIANSWEEAEQFCETMGGHLAIIDDERENAAVYEYMKRSGYNSAYFGLTDAGHEGSWYWVDGRRATYTNWSYGEPNNGGGTENYAMYYAPYSYTWNDGDFRGVAYGDDTFICEWDFIMHTR